MGKDIPELTALRGLAAGSVLLFHIWAYFPGVRAFGVLNHGWVAVDLFFVLSGFLLAAPFLPQAGGRKPDFAAFFGRRFFRIAPPYYVALGLAVLIPSGPSPGPSLLQDGATSGFLTHLGLHATYLHGLWEPAIFSMNPAFWTLGVEMQFYLALPLLAWLMTRRRAGAVLAAVVAATLVLRFALYTYAPGTPWITMALLLPVFLVHFCAGILVARIVQSDWRPTQRQRQLMMPAAALLLLPLATMIPGASFSQSTESRAAFTIVRPAAGLAFALLILWLRTGPRVPWMAAQPVQWLGTRSYSLYLVHMPILALLAPLAASGAAASWPIAFAASLAAGGVFYVLTEKPSLWLRDRMALVRARRAPVKPAVA